MCSQHALAVVEIAMTRHQDVVVARIVQPRILLRVVIDLDASPALLHHIEILGRVVMIVKVDDHERGGKACAATARVQGISGGGTRRFVACSKA